MRKDDAMWSVVMFDLPVKTKMQQREANRFRNLLLNLGYSMVQYSVYVRFLPIASGATVPVKTIKKGLPPQGEVRIVHVTDKQWSKGLRFANTAEYEPENPPDQLTIF